MLTIQQTNPLDVSDWDADIASVPGVTLFHGAGWARVLHDTYGYRPVYFKGLENQRIVGLLPSMDVDSWLTGRRGVSLPFTDECAPLCSDSSSFSPLFAAAREYGRARKWKSLELRGGASYWTADSGYRPSTNFWGHRLALEPVEATLFSRLESSVRRAVRKAEQTALQVDVSTDLAALATFYDLLCLTRKRHGVPPQSWKFFANIHRHILAPGKGCVVLARLGDSAVAGAVYLHSGKTVLYKYGASDEAQQHLRANNLVMWNGIKWHAERGFLSLDFGRTSLANEGLRRFKLSWGTQEYGIAYSKIDCEHNTFGIAEDKAAGWHTRIFQKMPIPIARIVGEALYRHVA
jgi:CelD/BcsL family acetyltransferase involved in cellulose biosynthesis